MELASVPLGDIYYRDTEYARNTAGPLGLHGLWYSFVTHDVPMVIYGVPWRSNAYQRHLASWRCDVHPAWSRDLKFVALNLRHPSTGQRVVAVLYVEPYLTAT